MASWSTYKRLEISDINDPDLPCLPLVRKVHLLPSLLQLDGVDPLVITRVPYIIKVVVHASTTGSVGFAVQRQTSDIAYVIR